MSTTAKVIISIVVIATSYAVGRYSAPEKIKIETRILEVEKKTEDKKQDVVLNKKKTTKKKETTNPDGSTTTETVITEDTNLDKTTDKTTNTDTSKTTETTQETTYATSKTTISALGGLDLSSGKPTWGASVYKPVLGPIGIGIWGLSNSTIGCSIGLSL